MTFELREIATWDQWDFIALWHTWNNVRVWHVQWCSEQRRPSMIWNNMEGRTLLWHTGPGTDCVQTCYLLTNVARTHWGPVIPRLIPRHVKFAPYWDRDWVKGTGKKLKNTPHDIFTNADLTRKQAGLAATDIQLRKDGDQHWNWIKLQETQLSSFFLLLQLRKSLMGVEG